MPFLTWVALAAFLWWWLPPTPRASFNAGDASVFSHAVFSPDGRELAIVQRGDKENGGWVLRLWSVDGDSRPRTIYQGERHPGPVTFSQDGTQVAARFLGGEIQVWDQGNGRRLRGHFHTAWKHWNPHCQIAFTPAGGLVVYGPDPASGLLWDAETGAKATTLFADETWQTVAGGYPGFVVLCFGTKVKAWDLARGVQCGEWCVPEMPRLGEFALSADGRFFAGQVEQGGRTRLMVASSQATSIVDMEFCQRIAVSPDGRALAATVVRPPRRPLVRLPMWLLGLDSGKALQSREVVVTAVERARVLVRLHDADHPAFSSDGLTFTVVGSDDTIWLYDWPLRTRWGWVVIGASVGTAVMLIAQAGVRWWRRRSNAALTPPPAPGCTAAPAPGRST